MKCECGCGYGWSKDCDIRNFACGCGATHVCSLQLKTCAKCKESKSIVDFHRMKRGYGGRGTYCKSCRKELDHAIYRGRSPQQDADRKARSTRNLLENRKAVYEYLLSHPCVDCGEANPVVLEFDHIQGKKACISELVGRKSSVRRIHAEIEKCEVRCANCHRIITARRSNSYRYRMYVESCRAR